MCGAGRPHSHGPPRCLHLRTCECAFEVSLHGFSWRATGSRQPRARRHCLWSRPTWMEPQTAGGEGRGLGGGLCSRRRGDTERDFCSMTRRNGSGAAGRGPTFLCISTHPVPGTTGADGRAQGRQTDGASVCSGAGRGWGGGEGNRTQQPKQERRLEGDGNGMCV